MLAKVTEQRLSAGGQFCHLGKDAVFFVWIWGRPAPLPVQVRAVQLWHPSALARHVSAALVAALAPDEGGEAPRLRLVYEDRPGGLGCFVLSTETPTRPFRLIFTEAGGDLQSRLGFDEPDHQNRLATRIEGRARPFTPLPAAVEMPSSWDGLPISMRKTFVWTAEPRLQAAPRADDPNPRARCTVDTSSSPTCDAWGLDLGALPSEYLVWGHDGDDGDDGDGGDGDVEWLVVDRAAPQHGLTTLLRLLPSSTVRPLRVAPIPACEAVVNLYFPPSKTSSWSRLAEIFGLRNGANLCGRRGLVAVAHWNLEPPPYLLLEFVLPHMSASIQHRFQDDLRTQLLGKVALYPQIRVERGYPLQKVGTGPSVLTQLHVRVLTPWHGLWQFHGREWSCSIVLAAQGTPVATHCS